MSFPAKWHILSLFLMPVVQCIVAQWRHISSESAVTFVLSMLISDNRISVITLKCDAQTIAWDILLVITSVAGNLCNRCPKQLLKQNSSYSDYFNAISGPYQTAEPQEALWHLHRIVKPSQLWENGNFSWMAWTSVYPTPSPFTNSPLKLKTCHGKWINWNSKFGLDYVRIHLGLQTLWASIIVCISRN